MSSPYHPDSYALHDSHYRPPQSSSAESPSYNYSQYPPKPNYTNERSNGLPNDPTLLAPKPPHETMDGAVLRGRTPSPTPSEQKELGRGAIDWKAMSNWRFWIRREWICTSDIYSTFRINILCGNLNRVLCGPGHNSRAHCSHDSLSQTDSGMVNASNAVVVWVSCLYTVQGQIDKLLSGSHLDGWFRLPSFS